MIISSNIAAARDSHAAGPRWTEYPSVLNLSRARFQHVMDTIEAAVLVMKLNRQITEEINSRFGVLFTNNGIINMRASSVTKAAIGKTTWAFVI